MQVSGNAKARSFFRSHGINPQSGDLSKTYTSRAATLYSGKVKKQADEAMAKYGRDKLLFKLGNEPAEPTRQRRDSDDFFKSSSFGGDSNNNNNNKQSKQNIAEPEVKIEYVQQASTVSNVAEEVDIGALSVTNALSAWDDNKTESSNATTDITINNTRSINSALNIGNIKKVASVNESTKEEDQTNSEIEASTNSLATASNTSSLIIMKQTSTSSNASKSTLGKPKKAGKAKKAGRLGGAKVKTDMSALEKQAEKEIQTAVQVKADALVTISKKTTSVGGGSGAANVKADAAGRLGMAGRGGMRTVDHGFWG